MDFASDPSIPVISFKYSDYDYDGLDWPSRIPPDTITVIDQVGWKPEHGTVTTNQPSHR